MIHQIPVLIDKIKKLIGSDLYDDTFLSLYAEQAYNESCGICNLKKMPDESLTNIAFLCVANLKNNGNDNIQSMSEGGRSVSFGKMTVEQMRSKALEGLSKWKTVRGI